MIIDGVFKGISEQVEEYCQLAKQRLIRDNLGGKCAALYYTLKLKLQFNICLI
jgi:hypothetical protein